MNNQFYFRYSKTVPKETLFPTLVGTNLCYITIPELDPSTDTGNLRIIDKSFSFPENNVLFSTTVTTFSNGSYISNDASNFLLTDVYGNASPDPIPVALNKTIPIRPLWYKYIFANNLLPAILPTGLYSVSIYDSNGVLISPDHYKLDTTNTVLYTDLINTDINTYYVVYMSGGSQQRRLLSVEPIFQSTNSFTADKQYIISIDPSDNRYVISVSDPNKQYSLMNIGNTKIYVKHPVQVSSSTDPWYVQIVNGYFKRITPNGDVYEYYVPEYTTQAWAPAFPFKLQVLETPIFIDNKTVQLKQTPLPKVSDNITNSIHLYVLSSTDRSGVTNEAINNGGKYSFVPGLTNTASGNWYELLIDDYDRNTGLVKIKGVSAPNSGTISTTDIDNYIYTTDTLLACYFYEEDEYTLVTKNFNPLVDPTVLTGGTSIYLVPAKSYPYPGASGSTLNAITVETDVVRTISFDNNENTTGGGQPIDEFFSQTNPTYLELARIFIGSAATINDVKIMDARIKGGDLADNLPAEIVSQLVTNTNGMFGFRNWDSATYPGYCVVVIKLPSYLLNDNFKASGTLLTDTGTDKVYTQRLKDIRTMCLKHIPTGTLPLIRFYDTSGNILPIQIPLDRNF